MADNPIKHDDIIQQGNPYDDWLKGTTAAIKGLKLLQKEIKKTAKLQLDIAKKQDANSKQGQENLTKVAKATKKLTEAEKQALNIRKQLEKQRAKNAFLRSKEGQEILKATEALKREEREIKKVAKAQDAGAKSTNTWTKAAGSFAAKFNTIGNVLANAVQKIVAGIKRTVNQFISFEKIIRSNQLTSDRYDQTIGKLKSSFEVLNRAIALGNFKTIGEDMQRAADAAVEYVLALDALADTQRALNIQNSIARREVKELQEVYNDTSQANEDRLEAALEAQKILNDLQAQQERIARETVNAELERVRGIEGVNDQQLELYRRFIENYGLLTDEQVTTLEQLEAKTVELADAEKKADKERMQSSILRTSSFVAGVNATEKAQDELSESISDANKQAEEYDKMIKELSETFGFDVKPVIDTIIQTTDDQRDSVGNSIIAYNDQIAATQRLISANAAMLGTIKNSIKGTKDLTKATQDYSDLLKDLENEQVIEEDDVDMLEFYNNKLIELGNKGFSDLEAKIEARRLMELEAMKQRTEAEDQEREDRKRKDEEEAQRKKDLLNAGVDAVQQTSDAIFSFQQQQLDKRFKAEIEAADGNAAKIEEIQKEQAREEQELAIKKALIDGALAIVKTFASYGFTPAGIAAAFAQATATGIQVAAIKKVQFADGGHGLLGDKGGVMKGPSHSSGGIDLGELGEAEGDEYFGIVNKRMTRKYKDDLPTVFDSLNKGRFHDVFSRANIILNQDKIFNDPYTRMMYEVLIKQGTPYTDSQGNQVIEYPHGRKRVIKQRNV